MLNVKSCGNCKNSRWLKRTPHDVNNPCRTCTYLRMDNFIDRRPITGNKSNAAQRAIKRGNKKTGRA